MAGKYVSVVLIAVAAWLVGRWLGTPSTTREPPAWRVDLALEPAVRALFEERLAAARRDPGSASAHGRLGIAYEVNGALPAALQAYANAVDLADPAARSQWRFRHARCLEQMSRAEDARQAYLALTRDDPGHAPAWERLGLAALAAGDLEAADAAFARVEALLPNATFGATGRGQVALARGDATTAVGFLEQAVRIRPEDRGAHYALGRAYLALGRVDEGRIELAIGENSGRLGMPDPDQSALGEAARNTLAITTRTIRSEAAKSAADVERLETVAAAHPEDGNLQVNLGLALASIGRTEAALPVLERAAALLPGDPAAQANLGECLGHLGRHEEALRAFERAIEISPRYQMALIGRGRVLMALGRRDECVAQLERAAAVDPSDARARLFLGQVYLSIGRRSEGVALVHESARHDLGDASTQLDIAETFLFIGDITAAQDRLALVRRYAPQAPRVAEIERRLASMHGDRPK